MLNLTSSVSWILSEKERTGPVPPWLPLVDSAQYSLSKAARSALKKGLIGSILWNFFDHTTTTELHIRPTIVWARRLHSPLLYDLIVRLPFVFHHLDASTVDGAPWYYQHPCGLWPDPTVMALSDAETLLSSREPIKYSAGRSDGSIVISPSSPLRPEDWPLCVKCLQIAPSRRGGIAYLARTLKIDPIYYS